MPSADQHLGAIVGSGPVPIPPISVDDINKHVFDTLSDEIDRQYDLGQLENAISSATATPTTAHYRPSSLGKTLPSGMCLHPCVTDYKPGPVSEGFKVMINHSNLLHVAYEAMLRHRLMQFEVKTELGTTIHFKDGAPPMAGTADIVVYDKDAPIAVYDIKTVRGNAFNYGNLLKDGHVLQLQAYMMGFDVLRGALIYIDREGQNGFRTFPIERDDAAVERAAQYLWNVLTGLENPVDIKPAINVNANGDIMLKAPWQMSYCDMGDGCICRQKAFGDKELPQRAMKFGKVDMKVDDGFTMSKAGAKYLNEAVMGALEEALMGVS
jgi:hypothetical protein